MGAYLNESNCCSVRTVDVPGHVSHSTIRIELTKLRGPSQRKLPPPSSSSIRYEFCGRSPIARAAVRASRMNVIGIKVRYDDRLHLHRRREPWRTRSFVRCRYSTAQRLLRCRTLLSSTDLVQALDEGRQIVATIQIPFTNLILLRIEGIPRCRIARLVITLNEGPWLTSSLTSTPAHGHKRGATASLQYSGRMSGVFGHAFGRKYSLDGLRHSL